MYAKDRASEYRAANFIPNPGTQGLHALEGSCHIGFPCVRVLTGRWLRHPDAFRAVNQLLTIQG